MGKNQEIKPKKITRDYSDNFWENPPENLTQKSPEFVSQNCWKSLPKPPEIAGGDLHRSGLLRSLLGRSGFALTSHGFLGHWVVAGWVRGYGFVGNRHWSAGFPSDHRTWRIGPPWAHGSRTAPSGHPLMDPPKPLSPDLTVSLSLFFPPQSLDLPLILTLSFSQFSLSLHLVRREDKKKKENKEERKERNNLHDKLFDFFFFFLVSYLLTKLYIYTYIIIINMSNKSGILQWATKFVFCLAC